MLSLRLWDDLLLHLGAPLPQLARRSVLALPSGDEAEEPLENVAEHALQPEDGFGRRTRGPGQEGGQDGEQLHHGCDRDLIASLWVLEDQQLVLIFGLV